MATTPSADATEPSDQSGADDTGGTPLNSVSGSKPRFHRRHPVATGVVLAALAVAVLPGVSFGKALKAPGSTSTSERAVEWLRDHGASGVVNTVEHWWFTNHTPPQGGEPDHAIAFDGPTPVAAEQAGVATGPGSMKPADLATPADQALPGEGVWQPIGEPAGGEVALYATQVRPDSQHTSVLDGLLWMNPKLTSFALHPGLQEPGGSWKVPSQVPTDERLKLLAAFNGAFRLKDSKGGFFLNGTTKGTLRDGAASFVVTADGSATVGAWNRDMSMTPDTTGVLQNLDLIVDGGQPVAGLDDNADGKWGETLGNKVLVWRSAVCVDSVGALIYGYGDALGAQSLAELMQRAGCQRAMELDINPSWTTANVYGPRTPGSAGSVAGHPLLTNQKKSGNRYLSNDSRDFIAVEAKSQSAG